MVESFHSGERHGIHMEEADGDEEHCDGEHGENVELVSLVSQE